MAEPRNPYIAGSAIRDQNNFFGRQDVLNWAKNELHNPGTNALVIFGQRRIGKTSLLHQLKRTLPPEDFIVTYFDLQDQATQPLSSVLSDLAETIAESLEMEHNVPGRKDYDDSGRVFRNKFLPVIYNQIPEPKRFVILLDEFDVLDVDTEARLAENSAARSLLPFIRRLISEEERLAFVFVAGRRPQDLSINFNQTFKSGTSREVWVLDIESAVTLIKRAEQNHTLHFTNSGIQKIIALTSGHPYLTQLVCQRVWERTHRSFSKEIPIVDPDVIDSALPDILQAGGQALQWLWEGLNPAERIYAAALAEISIAEAPIGEDEVIRVLVDNAARLRTREVELAPRELVKRRILEEMGEGFVFAIELFRIWVKENRSLQEVKAELDSTDLPSLQMYKVGVALYDERNWEGAISHFQEALNRNPKLFGAQLMLGETYFQQGKLDNAVIEFEKAYALDRDDTYLAYARALIAQAKEREGQGDFAGVIASSERAMKVSPNDKEAETLFNINNSYLLELKGQQLFKENNLEEAKKVFAELLTLNYDFGKNKRLEWQECLQKIEQVQVSDMENQAKSLMEDDKWVEAKSIYKHLLDSYINIENSQKIQWENLLLRCNDYMELSNNYFNAKVFMENAQWDEAIKLLALILARDPAYKDAFNLLSQTYQAKERNNLTSEPGKIDPDEGGALEKKWVARRKRQIRSKDGSIDLAKEEEEKKVQKNLQTLHLTAEDEAKAEELVPSPGYPVRISDKLLYSPLDMLKIFSKWLVIVSISLAGLIAGGYLTILLWDVKQWWGYLLAVLTVILGIAIIVTIDFFLFIWIGGSDTVGVIRGASVGETLVMMLHDNRILIFNQAKGFAKAIGKAVKSERFIPINDQALVFDNGWEWNLDLGTKTHRFQLSEYHKIDDINVQKDLALIYKFSKNSITKCSTNEILGEIEKPGFLAGQKINPDGRMVAVSHYNPKNSPYITNVDIHETTGELINHINWDFSGIRVELNFSPDGSLLAVAGGNTLLVYSIQDKHILFTREISLGYNTTSIHFLGGRDYLAINGDKKLFVIRTSDGAIERIKNIQCQPGISYNPQTQEIITISEHNTIHRWKCSLPERQL